MPLAIILPSAGLTSASVHRNRQVQMRTLPLEVDERELSTIQATLLLLQEQLGSLPEDLSELMSERGPLMTESEVGELASRFTIRSNAESRFDPFRPGVSTLVELERAPAAVWK